MILKLSNYVQEKFEGLVEASYHINRLILSSKLRSTPFQKAIIFLSSWTCANVESES